MGAVLRVTRRCVADDLGLPIEHASRDAQHYMREHVAVRTFVELREHAPDVGERVKGVNPYGGIVSLHVGSGRGATYYDAEEDVVWLLAYSATHATHERRDVYQKFMALGERDELLPTQEDYETLETISSVAILDAFEEQCLRAVNEARADPGHTSSSVVLLRNGQRSGIVALVDIHVIEDGSAEQGWVAFTFSPDTRLGPSQVLDLLDAVLPEGAEPEHAADLHGRPLHHNEVAFTWVVYASTDTSPTE